MADNAQNVTDNKLHDLASSDYLEPRDQDVFDDTCDLDTHQWHVREHAARVNDGYRRGLEIGQEETLQSGFDSGFNKAMDLSLKLSSLRGALTAILGVHLTGSHEITLFLASKFNESNEKGNGNDCAHDRNDVSDKPANDQETNALSISSNETTDKTVTNKALSEDNNAAITHADEPLNECTVEGQSDENGTASALSLRDGSDNHLSHTFSQALRVQNDTPKDSYTNSFTPTEHISSDGGQQSDAHKGNASNESAIVSEKGVYTEHIVSDIEEIIERLSEAEQLIKTMTLSYGQTQGTTVNHENNEASVYNTASGQNVVNHVYESASDLIPMKSDNNEDNSQCCGDGICGGMSKDKSSKENETEGVPPLKEIKDLIKNEPSQVQKEIDEFLGNESKKRKHYGNESSNQNLVEIVAAIDDAKRMIKQLGFDYMVPSFDM